MKHPFDSEIQGIGRLVVGFWLFGFVVGVLACSVARADVAILVQQELESSYEWRVVGTGDFNGDGVTDVLWENETTGQTVVWCFGPAQENGSAGGSILIGGGGGGNY